MEEKIQESTINTEQTVHQAWASGAFLDKIKNAFSPTQRKKTIAVIAIIFSVVVLLTVFFSTSNPKNIAQRYAKAYICGDLKTVGKLTAYDYKESLLGSRYDEETEETFFEKKVITIPKILLPGTIIIKLFMNMKKNGWKKSTATSR